MQIPSILLVEDSEDDAYFFTYSLKNSGLPGTLQHAADGAAAIQFLSEGWKSKMLPKVVFLDLKMPMLNGFDVLDWLRNQPFAGQIAVFILSGSDQKQDKERAARLGAAGFLTKPITQADLNRILGGGERGIPGTADVRNGVPD